MESNRILVVEDGCDDQDLIIRAFKKTERLLDVIVLKDGAEALDYINCVGNYAGNNASQLPFLILLDLKLPKIDGIEVLKAIRAHQTYRLVPVIILSSSGERTDVNTCYEIGANSYIRKPLDFRKFVDIVSLLLTYWLDINEPLRI